MERQPTLYILASRRNGTLYIGVTSNLARRMGEHREGLVAGFTRDHQVKRLVHIEQFGDMQSAILREKQLKKWRRAWKITLIESANSGWRDLGEDLGYPPLLSPESEAGP